MDNASFLEKKCPFVTFLDLLKGLSKIGNDFFREKCSFSPNSALFQINMKLNNEVYLFFPSVLCSFGVFFGKGHFMPAERWGGLTPITLTLMDQGNNIFVYTPSASFLLWLYSGVYFLFFYYKYISLSHTSLLI